MKKQILTSILFLFINNCFAQILYSDTINFESGLHQLTIDTSQINNTWQVGKPSKIIFNSAHSVPNAIVTDTLNPYPANNISSFTIYEPLYWGNIYALTFWHKYDTDLGRTGGYIELSSDKGLTWNNIISDTTVTNNAPWWGTYSYFFYDSSQTITGGIPAFSGTSNGWVHSEFHWQFLCAETNPHTMSIGDTLWFRFNFKSDSLQTGKEGWIIDDISFISDFCNGVADIDGDDFKVYPIPADNKLTLQLSERQTGKIFFQIYDVTGREVTAQSEINPARAGHKSEIDISSLQAGVYFLKINERENIMVKRFLKE